MPLFAPLPTMPKELIPSLHQQHKPPGDPYLSSSANTQRNAAIWSSSDDEVLLQARASGLNWQPIASRFFPTKTANACRKRHERLMERRHTEDWDARKLELLAQEYLNCRREMWEILASRVGERWAILEAKCMEKGLKALQSTARTAQRKASAASHSHHSMDERGISELNSDSGIGLSPDAEMDVGDEAEDHINQHDYQGHHQGMAEASQIGGHIKSASWHARSSTEHDSSIHDHSRSRSLPQPLALYQPPPPIVRPRQPDQHLYHVGDMTTTPMDITAYGYRAAMAYPSTEQASRYSPADSNASSGREGISIQSVLSG